MHLSSTKISKINRIVKRCTLLSVLFCLCAIIYTSWQAYSINSYRVEQDLIEEQFDAVFKKELLSHNGHFLPLSELEAIIKDYCIQVRGEVPERLEGPSSERKTPLVRYKIWLPQQENATYFNIDSCTGRIIEVKEYEYYNLGANIPTVSGAPLTPEDIFAKFLPIARYYKISTNLNDYTIQENDNSFVIYQEFFHNGIILNDKGISAAISKDSREIKRMYYNVGPTPPPRPTPAITKEQAYRIAQKHIDLTGVYNGHPFIEQRNLNDTMNFIGYTINKEDSQEVIVSDYIDAQDYTKMRYNWRITIDATYQYPAIPPDTEDYIRVSQLYVYVNTITGEPFPL